MELLKLFNVLAVHCPGITPTEERCNNNVIAEPELCEEPDVLLFETPRAKLSKALVCFTDP